MPKFILKWDIGFGPNAEVIEADSLDEARKQAYERAREDFENNADYAALAYSPEEAEACGAE